MILVNIAIQIIVIICFLLEKGRIKCECPKGFYVSAVQFKQAPLSSKYYITSIDMDTYNNGHRYWCTNMYKDGDTYKIDISTEDFQRTESSSYKWFQFQGSNVYQGSYFTSIYSRRSKLLKGNQESQEIRTSIENTYYRRVGINSERYAEYYNNIQYFREDRYLMKQFDGSFFGQQYYRPMSSVNIKPLWMKFTSMASGISNAANKHLSYFDKKYRILKHTSEKAGGDIKTLESWLWNHCNTKSKSIQKWMNVTVPAQDSDNYKCWRCNPKSKCLKCDVNDNNACVSCHDPFELDTATKLCKPKEGVTDKEGDSLIEGDGMDTFTGYPTPTIEEFDINDLASYTITNSNKIDGKNYMKCGFLNILGGPRIFRFNTVLKKAFTKIAPHYKIILRLTFYKWGLWHNNTVTFALDDLKIQVPELIGLSSQGEFENYYDCDDASSDSQPVDPSPLMGGQVEERVVLEFDHSTASLDLTISTDLEDKGAPYGYWGIRDVHMTRYKCDISCLTCDGVLATECLTCFENFQYMASSKTCTCMARTWLRIIENCQVSQCMECVPCAPRCISCSGPNADQCVGCDKGQLESIIGDVMTCVNSCPPKTYQQGTQCLSCGAICDNSIAINRFGIPAETTPNYLLVNGIFLHSNSISHIYNFVGRGEQKTHTVYKLAYNEDNQAWDITFMSHIEDTFANFFPFTVPIIQYEMNLQPYLLMGYSSGLYKYSINSQKITVQPKKYEKHACNNMFKIANSDIVICTSFTGRSIYAANYTSMLGREQIDANGNVVQQDGTFRVIWNCDIGHNIYSLYSDGLEDNDGNLLIWAGSQNVLWLILKMKDRNKNCQMKTKFQFSPVNANMEVRYILPSQMYNNHVIVAGAFDDTTAKIQVNTYQNKGEQTFYYANMIEQHGKGIQLQVDNLRKQELFKFHMMLVPKSTVVFVTTDKLVVQIDYLTFVQKSKFDSRAIGISVISQVNTNRTMFYRFHQNASMSMHYLWQPYPCLDYQMGDGDDDKHKPYSCYKCDEGYLQQKGSCVSDKCLISAHYVMDRLNQKCLHYQTIGTRAIKVKPQTLGDVVEEHPELNILGWKESVILDFDQTTKVATMLFLGQYQAYTQAQVDMDNMVPLITIGPKSANISVTPQTDLKHVDIISTYVSTFGTYNMVLHNSPWMSETGGVYGMYFTSKDPQSKSTYEGMHLAANGEIKVYSYQLRCLSISPFRNNENDFFCLTHNTDEKETFVTLYKQSQDRNNVEKIYQCKLKDNQLAFTIHANKHSQKIAHGSGIAYYVWLGIANQAIIIKIGSHDIENKSLDKECKEAISKTDGKYKLGGEKNINGKDLSSQAVPLAIVTLDPYKMNAVILMISYCANCQQIYVNTWVGMDGIMQTDNYMRKDSIILEVTNLEDTQKVKLQTIQQTTELIVALPDSVYVVQPLKNLIKLVYYTNKYSNLAVMRLSNEDQILLWIQSHIVIDESEDENIHAQGRIWKPTSICERYPKQNDKTYPTSCIKASDDYILKNPFLNTIKFCEQSFIKDGNECFAPKKTIIAYFEWEKFPHQFKIDFRDKTIHKVFGCEEKITDCCSYENKDNNKIKLKVFQKKEEEDEPFERVAGAYIYDPIAKEQNGIYTDWFEALETTRDATFFSVKLDYNNKELNIKDKIIKKGNQFYFRLFEVVGVTLQNQLFHSTYEDDLHICEEGKFYDKDDGNCEENKQIIPIFQFVHNPTVLSVTLNDADHHLLDISIDSNFVEISIDDLEKDEYETVFEKSHVPTKFFITFKYKLGTVIKQDQIMKIQIKTIKYDHQELHMENPEIIKLQFFKQPQDIHNYYFNSKTNEIEKKDHIRTLVYRDISKEGGIILKLNQVNKVFSETYEQLIQLNITQNSERLLSEADNKSEYEMISYGRKLQKYEKYDQANYKLIIDQDPNDNKIFHIQVDYTDVKSYLIVKLSIVQTEFSQVNSESIIDNSFQEIRLQNVIALNQSQKDFNQYSQDAFEQLNKIFVYSLSISLLIQGGNALMMQIGIIYKIIYKFRYINLNLPENVRGFYQDTIKLSDDQIQAQSKVDFRDQNQMPQELTMYNLSCYFLDNFGQYMYQILFLILIGIFLKIMRTQLLRKIRAKVLQTEDKLDSLKLIKIQQCIISFGYIYQAFVWNFLIAFGFNYYLDAIFFCFLTFKYPPIHHGKESMSTAVIVFLLLIFQIPRCIATILLLTQIIKEEKIDNLNEQLEQLDEYCEEQKIEAKKIGASTNNVISEVQALKDNLIYNQKFIIQNIYFYAQGQDKDMINFIFGSKGKYLFIEFFDKEYVIKYNLYLDKVERDLQDAKERKINDAILAQKEKELQIQKLKLKKERKEERQLKVQKKKQNSEQKQMQDNSPDHNSRSIISNNQHSQINLVKTNQFEQSGMVNSGELNSSQAQFSEYSNNNNEEEDIEKQPQMDQYDSMGNKLSSNGSSSVSSDTDSDAENVDGGKKDSTYKLIIYWLTTSIVWLKDKILKPNKYNRKEFFLSYKIIICNFKQNYMMSRYLLVLDLIRLTIIGFLLAVFQHTPFRQSFALFLILIVNFIIILYNFPYVQFWFNVIMFINEILLIIAGSGFLVISYYDDYSYYINYEYRNQIGQMICIAILIFLAFNSLIAIIMIVLQINTIFVKFNNIVNNLSEAETSKIKIERKEIIVEKKQFQEKLKNMKVNKNYLGKDDRKLLISLKEELSFLVKDKTSEAQKRILEIRNILNKMREEKQKAIAEQNETQNTNIFQTDNSERPNRKQKKRRDNNLNRNLDADADEEESNYYLNEMQSNNSNNQIMDNQDSKSDQENISSNSNNSRNLSSKKKKITEIQNNEILKPSFKGNKKKKKKVVKKKDDEEFQVKQESQLSKQESQLSKNKSISNSKNNFDIRSQAKKDSGMLESVDSKLSRQSKESAKQLLEKEEN